MEKSNFKYNCEFCNYNTNKKTDYNKHLLTRKHILSTNVDNSKMKKDLFICNNCGRSYKFRNSYWYHKKTCVEKKGFEYSLLYDNEFTKQILDLMEENKTLKEQLVDQNNQILDLATKIGKNTNTTNNTINNKFNLTVFLNESCKDAINIDDFVDSLSIHLNDLENTKDQGLVQSISNILINELNKLDVHKRPIHCTDAKRDILYVKENEEWKKDQEKDKIKHSISEIANKQRIAINQWTQANPTWMNDEKLKDEYVKLVYNLMQPLEETEKEQNKIIKKLSAATIIEK
tara:strand:- start:71 stop:937 length:867 start_codon:yes stop_codon:yes gene_type:complete